MKQNYLSDLRNYLNEWNGGLFNWNRVENVSKSGIYLRSGNSQWKYYEFGGVYSRADEQK